MSKYTCKSNSNCNKSIEDHEFCHYCNTFTCKHYMTYIPHEDKLIFVCDACEEVGAYTPAPSTDIKPTDDIPY